MMTQPDQPEIAVIVVNYGAPALALEAVESVRALGRGEYSVELHLVDNASPGDDAQQFRDAANARDWGDAVTLHLEDENHGFGRGNNLVLDILALRERPPKYVFLLNPDAALRNDAIAHLARFLDAHPMAAVAGARSVKPEGHSVTAAFRFPTLASEFAAALNFGPVSRLLQSRTVALDPDIPTQPVGWVSGASMMIRWQALADCGFFHPAYFLYYEEVDLMRRFARAGWETWYVREAEITHVEGASTDVRSAETRRKARPAYWYESWRLYFLGHGHTYALGTALARLTGAALNGVLARLRGREPAAPLHFGRDFRNFVIRPLLGLRAKARE